jgi:hypothetical protein
MGFVTILVTLKQKIKVLTVQLEAVPYNYTGLHKSLRRFSQYDKEERTPSIP